MRMKRALSLSLSNEESLSGEIIVKIGAEINADKNRFKFEVNSNSQCNIPGNVAGTFETDHGMLWWWIFWSRGESSLLMISRITEIFLVHYPNTPV